LAVTRNNIQKQTPQSTGAWYWPL